MFQFSSLLGEEDEPILTCAYFSTWVETQPPSSNSFMKRIKILRVPSYKSVLMHQHGGPHQQRYISRFFTQRKMGLASHLWWYFPVPRAQGTFQKLVNFYHFQDGKIIDMFISKGRKKSGLTFQGQLVAEISGYDGAFPAYRWAAIWQRQNGCCRTNQGDHLATDIR